MKPNTEQIALITGSTDGIGRIAAEKLAAQGTTVLVHGRDHYKCEETAREIRKNTGNDNVDAYAFDLSSLTEVRQLASKIRSEHSAINILINNAGILPGKKTEGKRLFSEDGYELCFAVNYLAPFLLTRLLLPHLERAAPARIVNVSSVAQKRLDFDDIMLERDYEPMRAYAQSKLALAIFTFELADRVKELDITANCLHPGTLLDTKMVRESSMSAQASAESGAEVLVHAATSVTLKDKTGLYLEEQKEARAHEQAYDQEARDKLWRLSEKLTDIEGKEA